MKAVRVRRARSCGLCAACGSSILIVPARAGAGRDTVRRVGSRAMLHQGTRGDWFGAEADDVTRDRGVVTG
jgi:hypothetical protein